ncbi:MAG: bleomycin resistance family protein [Candidatus Thiodiazotropha sp.]
MNTTLTPNLMSESVNESVAFYCRNLGFRFLAGMKTVGDNLDARVDEFAREVPLQWAMLGRDDARVMFQSRLSLARECEAMTALPLGVSGALYLEVADLDSLLTELGGEVQTVLADHTTFYGMREIWVRDNNGYILVLAQSDNPVREA